MDNVCAVPHELMTLLQLNCYHAVVISYIPVKIYIVVMKVFYSISFDVDIVQLQVVSVNCMRLNVDDMTYCMCHSPHK